MNNRLGLSTLLTLLTLLTAPLAHAETKNPSYTVVVFPALCGAISGFFCWGDDPLGHEATEIRAMWTTETALLDGGHVMPWDFNTTSFEPGRVYTVNTELIPPAPNSVAPIFGRARDFEIHAHFEAIRAWLEKAAAETDELIVVGHSFSAPGLVWALTTTERAEVHEKVKAIVTVAGPLMGHEFAGSDACGLYSFAFCSLDPAGATVAELRALSLDAIESPTIDLSRKLVGVASEVNTSATDGTVPVDSQLYLTSSWRSYRGAPEVDDNDERYLAVALETRQSDSHVYVNTGEAMKAAASWLDDRQLGGQHFCNAQSCEIYQGDCDSHAQCAGALRCMSNLGPSYGWSATTDVCEPRSNGALDYCSTEFRCSEGEGRCESNSECRSGLVCAGWFGVNYCRRPVVIPPGR